MQTEDTCPINSVPLHVHIEKATTSPANETVDEDQITVKRFCVNEDTSLHYLEEQVKTNAMDESSDEPTCLEWSYMKDSEDEKWSAFSCEEGKREEEWKDAIHKHRAICKKESGPLRLRVRAVPSRTHGNQCKSLGCRKTQHHQNCSIRSAWKMVGAAQTYCNNLLQQDSLLGCPFAFLKDILQGQYSQRLCPQTLTCTKVPEVTKEETCTPIEKPQSEYALQHESLAMMGFEKNEEQWQINEQLLAKNHGCLRSTMDTLYKLHK
jgi:hypothetical protein